MGFERRPQSPNIVEPDEGPPSEAVILAVAEAEDVPPTDIPSLYEVVDPDALDSLFRSRATGTVTFEYFGYTVTVRKNGGVIVHEPIRSEL